MANCTDKYASIRSGSSQEQRVLKALLPASAPVDERGYAELILFAKKFAAYLNYYNDNNVADGDWQPFMSMDVSVTLAGISNTPVLAYQRFQQFLYTRIKSTLVENDRKKFFKNVFDLYFSIATELDQYLALMPGDLQFAEYFSSTVRSRLQEPFQRMVHYYNQFVTAGYIDAASEFVPAGAPLSMILSQNFQPASLGDAWQGAVTPINLSVPDATDVSGSIYHIITHNVFNAQLETFFKTLANLVSESRSFLEQTLHDFPSHSPHYALFITFLHLYRKAQQQLNGFAGRHLDFYYRDVLQLTTKPAISDSAHLVFELQKGLEQHKIAAGTLFRGGKDISGKEISYAADEETVINRATVKSLQAVLVQQTKVGTRQVDTVFASPIANSDDGQGAKLTSAGNDWFAFGDPDKVKEARLGFMIASHYLYLNEGERKIVLRLFFTNTSFLVASDLSDAFDVQLTGEKDWHTIDDYDVAVNAGTGIVTFTILLAADAPRLVGFTEKVHKETYATTLPVVRFVMKNLRSTANPYKQLKSLALTKIGIEVSADGMRDLAVQNNEGALDASKPFHPFGAQPRVGSALIIGNKEVFQKKLSRLSVVVDWDEVPDSLVSQLDEALKEYERTLGYMDMKQKFHTVSISSLNKGKWIVLDAQKGIFIEDNLYDEIYNWSRPERKYARKLTATDIEHAVINISTPNIQPAEAGYGDNETFSNKSVNGFIRLELNHPDFGHGAYPEALRNAAQNVTVSVSGAGTENMTMSVKPSGTMPKEPYTPKIKTLTLSYTATTEIDLVNVNSISFEGRQSQFFHLHPFGYARANKLLQSSLHLLPAYANEGELFVGFENLLPGTTLKVLFQVADGTSNPLKEQATVEWFYLVNNVWKQFAKSDVIDATSHFSSAGIVTFSLPGDIASGNTVLDAALYWIKAVVKTDTDAVNKLISVQAQAIKASLVAEEEKDIYHRQAITANTISKLVVADAPVKKISQPFDSFGGRVRETNEQYYTRVSERLRHKQRAISPWDYEHMVLEEFPSLYKVKCIPHTGMMNTRTPGALKYSETVPGNVTIVSIPDLRNATYKNPLKPYTSIGVLTAISNYVKRYTSPFVKLFVINPKFEEVQFEFNVFITPPHDETFYVKQLSLDIEQFLCPWAYTDGRELEFGGKISKSVVLNFVEERPYVSYVSCFKMHHYIDRETATEKVFRDVEEAKASTGISILVSFYNTKTKVRHLIQHTTNCEC